MNYLVILIALAALGCAAPKGDQSNGLPKGASGSADTVTKPAVYVDVRTPGEFAGGHVVGAINIPHDQMEQRWQELAAYKDKPVVVYCRSGRRSQIALEVLEEHGFTSVENGGGLDDLQEQGIPTE